MSVETTEIYEPIQWRPFIWTPQREEAALVIAGGGTRIQAAEAAHCNKATIYEWLKHPDFCAEIDRLSLMVSISSRAERLRVAMRVAKSRGMEEEIPQTEKDLLDWLKFAQSETDGAKIDLSKLAEMLAGESAQVGEVDSGSRLLSSSPVIEVETQPVVDNDSDLINPS